MTQVFVNEICPSTTQGWVKKGALLVDVGEADEVNELKFNVPSLVHIPLTEFEDRYTELPMDKELVIVSQNGARSLRAAAFLVHKGYDPEKVVNMRHGMVRWVHKGFPVVDISLKKILMPDVAVTHIMNISMKMNTIMVPAVVDIKILLYHCFY